jgi:hypothetical protein
MFRIRKSLRVVTTSSKRFLALCPLSELSVLALFPHSFGHARVDDCPLWKGAALVHVR